MWRSTAAALPLGLGETKRQASDSSVEPQPLGAPMNVRYRVELSQTEPEELTRLLSGGKHAARKLKLAQILRAADAGARDEDIALSAASAVRRCIGPNGALSKAIWKPHSEPRPGAERKLSGKEETLLVATACSTPPKGARWTLECWPTRW
jgi:hypothetical protein